MFCFVNSLILNRQKEKPTESSVGFTVIKYNYYLAFKTAVESGGSVRIPFLYETFQSSASAS